MFSSTFFHWQNRVNLSLQGRAERARVEIPEKHALQRLPGFVWRQGAPLGHLGKEETPESPVWGPPIPLWAGRPPNLHENFFPTHLSMNFWKMPPRRFWQISSM